MLEITPITEESGYFDLPAKIGVYRPGGGRDVYLIDSGNDKDAGRRVRQWLDAQGLTLRGILNTHSHADHIGGNRYLQAQTGCRVFSGGIEGAITAHPVLEPAMLYGASPCAQLRNKFLMAQESDVTPLDDASFPGEIEALPLPGHSPDMVGFRLPDGVVFLADCVSSAETLEKYGLSYVYDVGEALSTLSRVEEMRARLFVPSHAPACEDIAPLARLNRERMLEAADCVAALCGEPIGFDALLRGVFRHFGMTMTVQQHALIGAAVHATLTYLQAQGRVQCEIAEDALVWRAL